MRTFSIKETKTTKTNQTTPSEPSHASHTSHFLFVQTPQCPDKLIPARVLRHNFTLFMIFIRQDDHSFILTHSKLSHFDNSVVL